MGQLLKSTKAAAGAIASGVVGYFTTKVMEVWGVLDTIAIALGKALKMSVTATQVGWTIALMISAILWFVFLRVIWRKPRDQGEAPALPNSPPSGGDKFEQTNYHGTNTINIDRKTK